MRIPKSLVRISPTAEASKGTGSDSFNNRRNISIAFAFVCIMASLDYILIQCSSKAPPFWNHGSPTITASMQLITYFVVISLFVPMIETKFAPREGQTLFLSALCTMLVGVFALKSFQNSGDEYAYLFQTWTYAAGRLWNTPPPLGQAMASHYVWATPDKLVGQYPPGWPLMMLPSTLSGLPGWTANVLLLSVSFFALRDLIEKNSDKDLASVATAVFALAPFTIFNAASYFPHMASAACTIVGLWSSDRLKKGGTYRFAILIGIAIGALGCTRTIDAALLAIIIGITLFRSRHFWTRNVWWIALGGAPFAAFLLWYQYQVTGNPFEPTYYVGNRRVDHLYLDWTHIKIGIHLTRWRVTALALWTSPPLIALWAVCLFSKLKKRTLQPIDIALPLTITVLLFYPLDGGNSYGPRYYMAFWLGVPYTIATACLQTSDRFRAAARVIMLMTILYGLVLLVFLGNNARQIVDERQDAFNLAEKTTSGPTIICLRSSTGLIYPMEPMDLARNGIGAPGRNLYVNCLPHVDSLAKAKYPTRKLYYYVRASNEATGRLLAE